MAVVIREQQVGPYRVVIKERLPDETMKYYTRFAILTYDQFGERAFLPDDFGYGNHMDYIERKFGAVVEAVTAWAATEIGEMT